MAKKFLGDLPEGMIIEILVRLPVKILLQCKSVCKLWLSIISDPHFVKSQLFYAITASVNNPTLLTLEKPPLGENEWANPCTFSSFIALVYTSGDDEEEELRSSQRVNEVFEDIKYQDLSSSPVHFDRLIMPHRLYPNRGFKFYRDHGVISSCNGIICLPNEFGTDVYLWNPSIRKCKKIPAPTPYTSASLPVDVGLGYDPISNDYKVIRILFGKKGDVVPIVQMYSTNAHCWREFRVPIYSEKLGGSSAMVFESGAGVDLWTLDDVSGKSCWTKRFSIKADSELKVWLCAYLGAKQFFGYKFYNQNTFLYDVLYDYEKKETNFFGYGPYGDENIRGTFKYTETLVSLDAFEQAE